MSAASRWEGMRLREKYARHFQVPLADVEVEDGVDDAEVWCPSRPDLPRWSTGTIGRSGRPHRPPTVRSR